MKKKAAVLLVDNHPVFRQGVGVLFDKQKDLKVVGEADDGLMAIEMVRKLSPDLVVMDISMPNLDGIQATRKILDQFPQVKVVALSVHSGKRFVREMLQAGAGGYILKESALEELVAGIRTVLAGEIYLSRSISELVIADYSKLLSGDDDGSETSPAPLLRTKLHRPPTTADIIPRTRLIEMLEEGCDRAMTLVSTPAGYGKSILASQWIEASRRPGAWISLDESDNDPREFLRYLLAALGDNSAGLIWQSKSLLKAAEIPEARVLARYLLNDLDQLKEPLILVLDDFHRISERKIHDLLAELLRYPSPNLHLVLLTRRDPPLPLGTIRAYGQLTELGVNDLRFTLEETTAFLERSLRIPVDQRTASALDEKLEGWITAIRLASISMSRKESHERVLQELNQSPQLVQEYLVREVFSQIPPAHSRRLMETALLDRFCAPLCDAVSSQTREEGNGRERLAGQAFLNWLRETHLFIIPLDDSNEWFRYHHLFQEHIRTETKKALSPEEISALHHRASEWFAGQQLIDEAIRHAMAGGDETAAIRLVEENRHRILNADRWDILERWLTRIPEKAKKEHPDLLLAMACMAIARLREDELPPLLERIESRFGQKGLEPGMQGEMNLFKSHALYFQGQGRDSLKCARKALEFLPAEYKVLVAEARLYLGLGNQMIGKKDKAVAELKKELGREDHPGGIHLTRLLAALAIIQLIDGDLEEAELAAVQMETAAAEGNFDYAGLWGSCIRGYSAFQANDLETAVRHLSRIAENRYIPGQFFTCNSLAVLAITLQGLGQNGKADEIVRELQIFARGSSDPQTRIVAASCRARIALMRGDHGPAINWAEGFDATYPPSVMMFFPEIPSLTRCRVIIATGTDAAIRNAESKLAELWEGTRAIHNNFQAITVGVLRAQALARLSRPEEALSCLDQVVALAGPHGWVRPFVEAGPSMAGLLKQLLEQNTDSSDIKRLLAALEEPRPVGESAASFPEQDHESAGIRDLLTRREFEILQHLAEGLGNRDIASRLFVSSETVKKHLYNIYRKLEVSSRVAAISKAAETGLVKKSNG